MRKRYEENKKKIDYSTMKSIERRRSINLQNGKIILVLGLGLITFGPITAASYKMSFCLSIISLIISLITTFVSYRAKKKKQYFTSKYSKQLWYFNIFLGMGIAAGIASVYNYYEVYKKVFEIIYVIMILYIIFSSQIIYYAAERKKNTYV